MYNRITNKLFENVFKALGNSKEVPLSEDLEITEELDLSEEVIEEANSGGRISTDMQNYEKKVKELKAKGFKVEVQKKKGTNDVYINYGNEVGKYGKVQEEVEQVDEISKDKAFQYLAKAGTDRGKAKERADTYKKIGKKADNPVDKNTAKVEVEKSKKQVDKRNKGIKLGLKKLTKEEIEAIEATLERYED